jgi:hypothetical protein
MSTPPCDPDDQASARGEVEPSTDQARPSNEVAAGERVARTPGDDDDDYDNQAYDDDEDEVEDDVESFNEPDEDYDDGHDDQAYDDEDYDDSSSEEYELAVDDSDLDDELPATLMPSEAEWKQHTQQADSLLGASLFLALVVHLMVLSSLGLLLGNHASDLFSADDEAASSPKVNLTPVSYAARPALGLSTASAPSSSYPAPASGSTSLGSGGGYPPTLPAGEAAGSRQAIPELVNNQTASVPAASAPQGPPASQLKASSTQSNPTGTIQVGARPPASSGPGQTIMLPTGTQIGKASSPQEGGANPAPLGALAASRADDAGGPGSQAPGGDGDRGGAPSARGGSAGQRGGGGDRLGEVTDQAPDEGPAQGGLNQGSSPTPQREYKVGEQVEFEPIKHGEQIAFEAIKHTEQKELVPYKNSGQKSFEGIKHAEQIAFQPILHAEQKEFEPIKHGEQIAYGTRINYDTPSQGQAADADAPPADRPKLPPGPLQIRAYFYPVNPYLSGSSSKGAVSYENAARVGLVLSVDTPVHIEFEGAKAIFRKISGDIYHIDEIDIDDVTQGHTGVGVFYYRNPLNQGDLCVDVGIRYRIDDQVYGQRIRLTPDRRGYPEGYDPTER